MTTARDIEEEAARWLVRQDRSELLPAEILAFEVWLAADARHRAAYLRLKAAWRQADLLKRMRPYDEEVDIDLLKPEAPQREWRRPIAVALIASVAVAIVSVGIVVSPLVLRTGWQTAATPFGGHEQLALADGTTLQLNSESEVKVRFTAARREVIVVRGEARFAVTHDPQRPFEVEADGAMLRVMGTAFTVRVYDPRRLDVLVEEGRVSVALAGRPESVLHALHAGHAAAIAHDEIRIRKVPPDAIVRKLAWTEGRIWLKGETLAEAVAEFNRYNHRKLVIADAALAQRRVEGSFEKTEIESFVRTLERSHQVRAVRSPATAGSPGEIRLFEK